MALINELTNIGNAIRGKTKTTELIPFKEMAERIQGIQLGSEHAATDPHLDANGKWNRPEEWDDIESITLPTDKDEVYYLFGCHTHPSAFCCLDITSVNGSATIEYGHVTNGVFTRSEDCTPVTTVVNKNTNFRMYLADREDDYLVVKISSEGGISYCLTADWSADDTFSALITRMANTCLMRYGRLSYARNINLKSSFIESDYVKDFASAYWDATTTITLNSCYQYCNRLQRLVMDGWDISRNNVTNLSSVFQECLMLQDFGDVGNVFDATGWVKSNCTNIVSLFNHARSIKKVIAKNWDFTNCTDVGSAFLNMRALFEIEGTETWTGGRKITSLASFFSGDFLLDGTIDMSNMEIGFDSSYINYSSVFNNCQTLKHIKLGNINMANINTFNGTFNYTYSLDDIDFSKCTGGLGSKCVSINSAFANSAIKSITLDGWSFAHVTSINNIASVFSGCNFLQSATLTNFTMPTSLNDGTGSNGWFYTCYNLRELNVSGMSFAGFSNVNMHKTFTGVCRQLIEYYPPTGIHKEFIVNESYILSHDSIMRIIENLDTVTTATTLKLGSSLLGKITDDEKAIATAKGWTLV